MRAVWANDRIEVEIPFRAMKSREICGVHVGKIRPPGAFGCCLISARYVSAEQGRKRKQAKADGS